MNNLVLFLPDSEATLLLGEYMGSLLAGSPGLPLMLEGEMGSGKTTLARGIVAPLPGAEMAEVASPSFTLVNIYPTMPMVIHADLFRNSPDAQVPEELEEALEATGAAASIVLVEWPKHMPARVMPAKRLDIFMQACHGSRLFSASPHGDAARALCRELAGRVHREQPGWLSIPGTQLP